MFKHVLTEHRPIEIAESIFESVARTVAQRCEQLAQHSDSSDGCTRTFCSEAMKTAHQQLTQWMQKAHLDCELDPVGNLIGCPRITDARPIFLIGSHLDTVINAGRYDGMLGVLLGVAVVEVLAQAKIELPVAIHVVAFSEEEGVRYKLPFIGSRGLTGTFDPTDFQRVDAAGISMASALRQFGCDPDQLAAASYAGKNCVGFMETHIEQAVELQNASLPVGMVSAIAGQFRATIVFEGMAGHAGTVRPAQRRDALAAAAELILVVERLGQETEGLFSTVGSLVTEPGLSNVICSRAELRLDLRHETDEVRQQAFGQIENAMDEISKTRHVKGIFTSVALSPAMPMDKNLTESLNNAIVELGWSPKTLVSGAGHDAMIMAKMVPSCMLFVRCRDGISHHPDEFVATEDILAALKVMVRSLVAMASHV